MQEQKIIRKVTRIGNGAHIFAPKEWVDSEVVVTLVPRTDVKEEIIDLLYPHLNKINGVFLYGSYARNEQRKESDIDVLVIAKEKFKVSKPGFDIIVIKDEDIEKAIKTNPILMYSIIKESKPILNPSLLDNLKKIKINKKVFSEFIKSTKLNIITNREIIELDKQLNNSYASSGVIYSLILRLRGIFIINSLIKSKSYSNELFEKWLISQVKGLNYSLIYEVYQAIRDDNKIKHKISINDVNVLLSLLEKETEKLEKIIK
ncbi:MAG: DUF2080 family transposase-associated protein [Candidatus Pacearchaeota archaeon]|jgi:predicted nucleotidyltransferase